MLVGSFQVGCFYGPTFSTVQELVPPHIRATVVAFLILFLNLAGLGFGITAGGFVVDHLIATGVDQPYSKMLLRKLLQGTLLLGVLHRGIQSVSITLKTSPSDEEQRNRQHRQRGENQQHF